jgi:hypothetical protein
MKTVILGLVVVAAIGCGRPIEVDRSKEAPTPAGAADAIAAVAAMYGMRQVPEVHWYAWQPECADVGDGGGFMEYGECYDGVTSDDGLIVIVRVPPDGVTLGGDIDGVPGDAVLPHELGHAASIQRGDGMDQDHLGHFFAHPGGDVERATEMLVANGE